MAGQLQFARIWRYDNANELVGVATAKHPALTPAEEAVLAVKVVDNVHLRLQRYTQHSVMDDGDYTFFFLTAPRCVVAAVSMGQLWRLYESRQYVFEQFLYKVAREYSDHHQQGADFEPRIQLWLNATNADWIDGATPHDVTGDTAADDVEPVLAPRTPQPPSVPYWPPLPLPPGAPQAPPHPASSTSSASTVSMTAGSMGSSDSSISGSSTDGDIQEGPGGWESQSAAPPAKWYKRWTGYTAAQRALARSTCNQALSTLEHVRNQGIPLQEARRAHLQEVLADLPAARRERLTVLAINVPPSTLALLRAALPSGDIISSISLQDDDALGVVHIAGRGSPLDVLLLYVGSNAELTWTQQAVLAVAFGAGRPVISLTHSKEASEHAHSLTGGYYPAVTEPAHAAQLVAHTAPALLWRYRAVLADCLKVVEPFKDINKARHFVTRAAVALVPFALTVTDLLSLMKLVGRMMVALGMPHDQQVDRRAYGISMPTAVKTLAAGYGTDVYQFGMLGLFLSDLLLSEGIAASLGAIDVVTLGSVNLITGFVMTIVAYFSRPRLVHDIASFLAALQTAALTTKALCR